MKDEHFRLDLLLLVTLFLLLTSLNLWLYSQRDLISESDLDQNLYRALTFRRLAFDTGSWRDAPFSSGEYPPLIYALSAIFFHLTDPGLPLLALYGYISIAPFLLLLLVSAYNLGRVLGGRALGWLVVLMFSTQAEVLYYGRLYYADLPLLALVTFGLWCLFRCRDFTSTRHSLLLGVSWALGMLTRFTFPFFMLLPCLMVAIPVIARARHSRAIRIALLGLVLLGLSALAYMGKAAYAGVARELFFNFLPLLGAILLLLALAVHRRWGRAAMANLGYSFLAACLAIPWYLLSSGTLLQKFQFQFEAFLDPSATAGHWPSLLAPNLALLGTCFPAALILIPVGIVFILLRRSREGLLLLAGLGGGFFLTVLGEGSFNPRYMLAALPFSILLGTFWFGWLPPRQTRIMYGLAFALLLLRPLGWLAPLHQDAPPLGREISFPVRGHVMTASAPDQLALLALLLDQIEIHPPPDQTPHRHVRVGIMNYRMERELDFSWIPLLACTRGRGGVEHPVDLVEVRDPANARNLDYLVLAGMEDVVSARPPHWRLLVQTTVPVGDGNYCRVLLYRMALEPGK